MGVCLEMKAGSVCYEGGCVTEMVSVHAFVCMLLRQFKMIMGGCNSIAIQFSTLTHAQTAHISWQGFALTLSHSTKYSVTGKLFKALLKST